jgi:hypothetical protein
MGLDLLSARWRQLIDAAFERVRLIRPRLGFKISAAIVLAAYKKRSEAQERGAERQQCKTTICPHELTPTAKIPLANGPMAGCTFAACHSKKRTETKAG